MPRTQAVYYREPDGSEPVNDSSTSLTSASRRHSISRSTGLMTSRLLRRRCRFPTPAKFGAPCASCGATAVRSYTACSIGGRAI
jgi:hypothetical protein